MVLEVLVSPKNAVKSPFDFFFLALLFISFAIPVHLFIPTLRGSVIIFALIPSIPVMLSLFLQREEEQERALHRINKFSFEYHKPVLAALVFYFLGAALGYTIWYALLPPAVSSKVFADQISEINALRSAVSGSFFDAGRFSLLFSHNLIVLAVMFLFSVMYGIGALYTILWNASVLAVVIGSEIRASGILGFFTAVASMLPHGAPEIGGYLVASIAGGILSAAVARGHYRRKEFKYIMLDVALLAMISILLIAIGAAIESSGSW
ncbi:MAG: stage II sporulation protein M [Candidatus Micrarchaeota archaeon]|nr:stage II sporulation protein M [Candidatus Micrarchaeota archaeon]